MSVAIGISLISACEWAGCSVDGIGVLPADARVVEDAID
jgi:hypothetical protein